MASNPLPRAGAKADRQRNVGAAGFVTDRSASNISLLSDRRRRALWPREIRAMIASDAVAQHAPSCPLDHPQCQPVGRVVRLRREPASGHRRLVNTELHGALADRLQEASAKLAKRVEG